MLDLNEIDNAIYELENGNTTYNNCDKLASLYIVREHLQKQNSPTSIISPNHTQTEKAVIKEYSDILPSYKEFISCKKRYKLNEVTEQAVIDNIKSVCKEIEEFIKSLYSSTDMPEERHCIKDMINSINLKDF